MAKQGSGSGNPLRTVPEGPPAEYETASTVIRAAVDRALSPQQAAAVQEVEAILDAALRVTERVAPAAPRVVDIVAAAGTSNQSFYRYFSGKDELMFAVLERGMQRVCGYLKHQMAKQAEPRGQIEAWIRGVLAQVTDRQAASQSAALNSQLTRTMAAQQTSFDDLRQLLVEPIRAAGGADPEHDALLIQEAVVGTMRRHLVLGTAPTPAEVEHAIAFCLRGVDLPPAGSGSRRGGGAVADH